LLDYTHGKLYPMRLFLYIFPRERSFVVIKARKKTRNAPSLPN
jgi:hypothetical protein